MMTKDLFNGLCDEIQAQKDLLFDYKKENIELKHQLQARKEKEEQLKKEIKLYNKGIFYNCAEDLIEFIERYIINEGTNNE